MFPDAHTVPSTEFTSRPTVQVTSPTRRNFRRGFDIKERLILVSRTTMRPLDPAIKTVWTLNFAFWWMFLVVGVLAYDILNFFNPNRPVPFGVLTGAVLAVGLAIALTIPRLRYRYWKFDLSAQELYLERGIFNRVRTIVPLRRIQHLDVSQNVIERNFGLGKLVVHTAGTRSSDVVLPGLRYEEAERLRDEIRHYVTEDAV